MDRNTLLKSSQIKFLSIFNDLIKGVVSRSIEKLSIKADKSFNSQAQQLLDARNFVKYHEHELNRQIIKNLNSLLELSFKAAYNKFRPSFFNESKISSMELMDLHALEDDFRIDSITSRFRSEVEGQLRELNTRIAILFERNDIDERENPFRPYLLTRAIILSVETTQLEPELFIIITDQLAGEFLPETASLYEGLNVYLSECGIGEQLRFKVQPITSDPTCPVEYDNDKKATADTALTALMHARQALMPDSFKLPAHDSHAANLNSTQSKKIEQLLNMTNVTKAHQEQQKKLSLLNQASTAVNGWLDGAHEVGDSLRRVFFGGSQNTTNVDALSNLVQNGSNFISISPQLSHALRIPLPSMDEMIKANGDVRNLLIESRDNLNSLASDQHEKMTIDVVAMLFEFILKDHQVPVEVRAQLGRLQFSVLKMALMDSALLTKKTHPARLLVNRIGSISVGLQQAEPSGERVSAEICRIVEEWLTNDSESPVLFGKMLDQLDAFITRELLASNRVIENAVTVVANAEHRSPRFLHTSAQLEELLNGIAISSFLRQFLLDTWPHVIEKVERNPSADSTKFRLLVPNLVWSVLPKTSFDDRCSLLQIIPTLIPILREAMSLVTWPPEHQQELLNWLVDAHTSVMRSAENSTDTEPALSLSHIQNQFHHFVYPDKETLAIPKVFKSIEVNHTFLDEAIKERETELHSVGLLVDLNSNPDLLEHGEVIGEKNDLSFHAEFFEPSVSQTDQTNNIPESITDSAILLEEKPEEVVKEIDILDRLRSGVVVEINLSGIPTQGRLNWISPNSSNLILTINGQETPSVISVRMFRRMLKNSRARFVEVAPLFERAVQSLLESADQVDLTKGM